jgi:hypothetical protein
VVPARVSEKPVLDELFCERIALFQDGSFSDIGDLSNYIDGTAAASQLEIY